MDIAFNKNLRYCFYLKEAGHSKHPMRGYYLDHDSTHICFNKHKYGVHDKRTSVPIYLKWEDLFMVTNSDRKNGEAAIWEDKEFLRGLNA